MPELGIVVKVSIIIAAKSLYEIFIIFTSSQSDDWFWTLWSELQPVITEGTLQDVAIVRLHNLDNIGVIDFPVVGFRDQVQNFSLS